MANARTKSEAEYRRLLAEQARSGKTMKEFAEERGLPVHRLWWWKGEIRRREAKRGTRKARRAEEVAATASAAPGPRFLPVRVVEPAAALSAAQVGTTSGYELGFGGRLLRLPTEFDPTRVAALVRAVEAAC